MAGLGGAAASANIVRPRSVVAQQRGDRIPHVGIIDDAPIWDAFRKALGIELPEAFLLRADEVIE